MHTRGLGPVALHRALHLTFQLQLPHCRSAHTHTEVRSNYTQRRHHHHTLQAPHAAQAPNAAGSGVFCLRALPTCACMGGLH